MLCHSLPRLLAASCLLLRISHRFIHLLPCSGTQLLFALGPIDKRVASNPGAATDPAVWAAFVASLQSVGTHASVINPKSQRKLLQVCSQPLPSSYYVEPLSRASHHAPLPPPVLLFFCLRSTFYALPSSLLPSPLRTRPFPVL